jgi:hypothetical protein
MALACVAGSANATIVDLTHTGGSGVVNGGRFETNDFRSAGTGVIDPFVRIQANGNESGYNTSGTPLPFDDKAGPFTRNLTYGEVPTRNIGGVDYKEFLLDINQTNANSLLSMNAVKLFKSGVGSQTTTNVASLGTLVYDLDAGSDSTVEMDYSLNSGSGQGDMRMFIPVSAFGSITAGTFLYLYTEYGTPNPTNDGFEEWAVQTLTPVVPLPPAALAGLGGLAAVGAVGFIRRRRMA